MITKHIQNDWKGKPIATPPTQFAAPQTRITHMLSPSDPRFQCGTAKLNLRQHNDGGVETCLCGQRVRYRANANVLYTGKTIVCPKCVTPDGQKLLRIYAKAAQ